MGKEDEEAIRMLCTVEMSRPSREGVWGAALSSGQNGWLEFWVWKQIRGRSRGHRKRNLFECEAKLNTGTVHIERKAKKACTPRYRSYAYKLFIMHLFVVIPQRYLFVLCNEDDTALPWVSSSCGTASFTWSHVALKRKSHHLFAHSLCGTTVLLQYRCRTVETYMWVPADWLCNWNPVPYLIAHGVHRFLVWPVLYCSFITVSPKLKYVLYFCEPSRSSHTLCFPPMATLPWPFFDTLPFLHFSVYLLPITPMPTCPCHKTSRTDCSLEVAMDLSPNFFAKIEPHSPLSKQCIST